MLSVGDFCKKLAELNVAYANATSRLPRNKPKTIVIEGMTGSGKSSLIKKIQEKFNNIADIFPEPVHLWTNYNNCDLLVRFIIFPYFNCRK